MELILIIINVLICDLFRQHLNVLVNWIRNEKHH